MVVYILPIPYADKWQDTAHDQGERRYIGEHISVQYALRVYT